MSNYNDNKDLFLEPKTKQYNGHMVMTNVHKETKTKYINIDTRFRDDFNYGEVVNYNITLPERITDVKTMTVTNIELPNIYYNISAILGNNYFKIVNTSKNLTFMITLPDGQYTYDSLSTKINSLFDQLYNGNISLNSADIRYGIQNTKSLFYTNGDSYTIYFAVDSLGAFDKNNIKSKLGWLLGFRGIDYTVIYGYIFNPPAGTGPDGQPLTGSESIIDLNGPRYFYLAIDEFARGNQSSFVSPISTSLINKNVLARISLDKNRYDYGTILPVNRMNGSLLSDTRSYTGKIDLLKLNIQLLNEYGVNVGLLGFDFSFCLEVEHE